MTKFSYPLTSGVRQRNQDRYITESHLKQNVDSKQYLKKEREKKIKNFLQRISEKYEVSLTTIIATEFTSLM